jgi:hypothetical protein
MRKDADIEELWKNKALLRSKMRKMDGRALPHLHYSMSELKLVLASYFQEAFKVN